jgi:predicted metal-dependent enzyme (double-stranded beta helix superfamily)
MSTGARFDLDELLSACRAARSETEPRRAIRDLLERTMADPAPVAEAMRPERGGFSLLHHEPDLTVLHVVWAPGMRIYPHNHEMWAAIGIYAGQEDNSFYRRSGDGRRTLVESGGRELRVGDVAVLGREAIHAVANPTRGLTGAIHVYGGDFINQPRSQWDPDTLAEQPYNLDQVRRLFAQANADWAAQVGQDLDEKAD